MAYPPANNLKRPYPGQWDVPPRPPKDPMIPSQEAAFFTTTGQNWGESVSQNYYSQQRYDAPPQAPRYDPYEQQQQRYNTYDQGNSYDYEQTQPRYGNYDQQAPGYDSYEQPKPDFTDDYSAFYGKTDTGYGNGNRGGGVQRGGPGGQRGGPGGQRGGGQFPRGGAGNQRGGGSFQRGRASNRRGSSVNTAGRGRGGVGASGGSFSVKEEPATNQTNTQSFGGGGFQQNRGSGNQNRGGQTQFGGRGQNRGRGGRGQTGMPPNVFSNNNTRGRGRGGNKTTLSNNVVVPPVHSLAKAKVDALDIENMSVAEKLHRFCLFLRADDSVKVNAVQTIMNSLSSSKLKMKAVYTAEELIRVDNKPMFTGVLKLNDVFLARAVKHNKNRELKQEVFQKALDIMLTMTVAEIFNLVDPGKDAIREEIEKITQTSSAQTAVKTEDADQFGALPLQTAVNSCEDDAARAEVKSLVGSDLEHIISQIVKFVQTPSNADNPMSLIEQASAKAHTIIKQDYKYETVKLAYNRTYCVGKVSLGSLVLGRGSGGTRRMCKIDTYTKTLERLKTKPVSELLVSVPEEDLPTLEVPLGCVNQKATVFTVERRFADLITKLKHTAVDDVISVNQIDCGAMHNGLTPMVIVKKEEVKSSSEVANITCDIFLENIFIASGQGITKKDAINNAYRTLWEVLKITPIKTIVNDHRRITEEERHNPKHEVILKGLTLGMESNITGLRKYGYNVKELEDKKISDLIIIENLDWSRDRVHNAFQILQSSCNQCGLLMQWETDALEGSFRCSIMIQKQQVGMSYGSTKGHVRNLAAADALFKLYETNDVMKLRPKGENSDKWIPFEKISAAVEKLKEENVGEEPIIKTDELGNPLPDKFLMQVLMKEVEDYLPRKLEEELTFGPGIGAVEARELRARVRDMGLRCDTLHWRVTPHLMIYERFERYALLEHLKKLGKPYGKYEYVKKEDLPKHADIESSIIKSLEDKTEKPAEK
ncbi:hypothetical protein ACF0H5_022234 [Mactra antiquata]